MQLQEKSQYYEISKIAITFFIYIEWRKRTYKLKLKQTNKQTNKKPPPPSTMA